MYKSDTTAPVRLTFALARRGCVWLARIRQWPFLHWHRPLCCARDCSLRNRDGLGDGRQHVCVWRDPLAIHAVNGGRRRHVVKAIAAVALIRCASVVGDGVIVILRIRNVNGWLAKHCGLKNRIKLLQCLTSSTHQVNPHADMNLMLKNVDEGELTHCG